MNTRRLARKARRQAIISHFNGEITDIECEAVLNATKDKEILQRWAEEIDKQLTTKRLYGSGWKSFFRNVWDWFKNNWEDILKILFQLLPLILMERYNADSKPIS